MKTLSASDRSRNVHGVTMKQERFAQEVAINGRSLVDAYCIAYGIKLVKPHHRTDASNTAGIPAVDRRIARLLAEQKENMVRDSFAIRRYVFTGLMRETEPENNPSPSARVAALVKLGEIDIVGMFRPAKEVAKEERRPEDIEMELRDRLARLAKPRDRAVED